MQWIIRFVAGGIVVSLFATAGDILKPKGFAGLFGAAPAVALVTLGLTVINDGKSFASMEARSMLAGAVAFIAYAILCVYLMGVRRVHAATAALSALAVWGIAAAVVWAGLLR